MTAGAMKMGCGLATAVNWSRALMLRVIAMLAALAILGALAAPAHAAGGTTAKLTFPTNGASNIDSSKPFTWSTINAAQGYYLYVGTSVGAKDLVDSRQITATSFSVPPLPSGQTLYARIWTLVNGTWTFDDSTFTAAPYTKARLSYPTDGSAAVDPSTPFSWWAVSDAQAYTLNIGTTLGGKDLLNTNEITATSYQVPSLPAGRTLYARLWTKRNGTWSSRDISFVATQPSRATLTYPQSGATNVVTSKNFAWNPVPDAQSYYLYVGTSQGANDLVNSGSTTATSMAMPPLPVGQTLWARLWTYVNNTWLYSDVSFQVSISVARLSYPAPGATDVDTRTPFSWGPAPNAQAYYLWLGTASGKSDLFNSGATTATSLKVPPLPVGKTIYARLFTQVNGSWANFTESTFTVAYSAATLTYPSRSDASNVDLNRPLTWAAIDGADAYAVWIGSSPGGSDLGQSGELTTTSYKALSAPAGGTIWIRLWTHVSGAWVYASDVPLSAAPRFIAPAEQAIDVDPGQPISWAPGVTLNSQSPTYRLTIGSTPAGSDLYDSGQITSTSVTPPSAALPGDRVLYARLTVTLGNGSQQIADDVFATNGSSAIAPATLRWPDDTGSTQVDVSRPFAWSATDLAQAYELKILDATNAVVVDSGAIQVPRYFAETLPPGDYTAQLGTELAGTWQWHSEPFTVVANGTSAQEQVSAAHWATDFVRDMSDRLNVAYPWTELSAADATLAGAARHPSTKALCADYSDELLRILKQMNVTAQLPTADQPARFNTYFSAADGHTMVKFYNSADDDWIVLDPTFDIAMRRASDGHWATIDDAHAATMSRNWSAIEYVGLGRYGVTLPHLYYVDYPLLYLNPPGQSPWLDPLPYMTRLDSLPQNHYGTYALTSDQHPVTVVVDGRTTSFTFGTSDALSAMFLGSTASLPSDSTANVTAYAPNWYVFSPPY